MKLIANVVYGFKMLKVLLRSWMPFERLGEVLDRQIELTHNQIPLKDISKR